MTLPVADDAVQASTVLNFNSEIVIVRFRRLLPACLRRSARLTVDDSGGQVPLSWCRFAGVATTSHRFRGYAASERVGVMPKCRYSFGMVTSPIGRPMPTSSKTGYRTRSRNKGSRGRNDSGPGRCRHRSRRWGHLRRGDILDQQPPAGGNGKPGAPRGAPSEGLQTLRLSLACHRLPVLRPAGQLHACLLERQRIAKVQRQLRSPRARASSMMRRATATAWSHGMSVLSWSGVEAPVTATPSSSTCSSTWREASFGARASFRTLLTAPLWNARPQSWRGCAPALVSSSVSGVGCPGRRAVSCCR